MNVPPVIELIEPTLATAAGHCHSFVHSLLHASPPEQPYRLWLDRKALVAFDRAGVTIQRHFHRRLRKLEAVLLYRRLLASPNKLFIATAGYSDFLSLAWAARSIIPAHKVYLYVHWFNARPGKLQRLARIAAQQPHLEVLGPTATVVDVFREAGFRARVVPYPISPVPEDDARPVPFHHLLYAGAARRDKGFRQAVDLVAFLAERGDSLPVWVQASPEHFGKYDADTLADLQRLQTLDYPPLKLFTETLDEAQYHALFRGAIVLQLYDARDFADRISGVTLDAFSHACPILTTAGTWMARQAEQFQAGMTCSGAPAEMMARITAMISNYAAYATAARHAGQHLQQQNHAGALYRVLAE